MLFGTCWGLEWTISAGSLPHILLSTALTALYMASLFLQWRTLRDSFQDKEQACVLFAIKQQVPQAQCPFSVTQSTAYEASHLTLHLPSWDLGARALMSRYWCSCHLLCCEYLGPLFLNHEPCFFCLHPYNSNRLTYWLESRVKSTSTRPELRVCGVFLETPNRSWVNESVAHQRHLGYR